MQEINDAIVAAIRAEGCAAYDGNVPTDQARNGADPADPLTVRVVTVELPYAVLYANFGDDYHKRLGGRTSQRSKFWQVTSVGSSPQQANWVNNRVRRALKDRRLTVYVPDPATGRPTNVPWQLARITVEESQRLRRDDTTTDANGDPVYLLVDTFSTKVSLKS